jgi:hypothetical protein
VGADERHEFPDAEAHVRKVVGQHFDGAVGVGEKAIGGNILGCFPPDVSLYCGAAWAGELEA